MADSNVSGQPTRSATQDANQGIINPPSIKREAEQYATIQKPDSKLSEGIQNFSSSLGNALVKGMGREADEINNRREMEATARQGNESAINSIDKGKKRTGWTKAIFGQNIEYRVAQQRAATNGVNDLYLQELNNIDSNAGTSPEEYTSKLTQSLNDTLKKYDGDKETQTLVKARWLDHSKKLSAKQYESHYAYNQQQQRETYQTEVEQTFDAVNLESGLITSQEEAAEIQNKVYDMLAGKGRPDGMADEAHRLAISEVIQKNLRQGNIGAYNAAKTYGWFDENTEKEQITLDRALSEYDQKFTEQVTQTWEEAALQVEDNKTYEGMIGIYENLKKQLDVLGKRSSGTPKAETALTKRERMASKGIADVIKNREMVNEELDKFFEEGMSKARKEEAKAKQLADVKAAVSITNPIDRAGTISLTGANKSDQAEAMDLVLLDDITRLTGADSTVTPLQATQDLLANPQIAKQVRQRLKGKNIESPLVKQATETVLNGINGLVDEKGLLTDQGTIALNSIAVLAEDSGQFMNMVGKENYDKYQIIQRGMPIGQTIDQMQKHIDKYNTAKADKSKLGSEWSLKDGESKRDRITQLYHNFTGQYPSSQTLAYYMKDYDRALIINDQDRKFAEGYLKTSIESGAVQYNGMMIQGGKELTKDMEYGLPELLDFAQTQLGDDPSLLTTPLLTLGAVRDKDGKVSRLGQVAGINFRVVEDSLWIDSVNAQSPVRIGKDTLQRWARSLKEAKGLKLQKEESDDESFDRYMKDYREEWKNRPLKAGF